MIYYILGSITLFCFLMLGFVIIYNNFQTHIIAINEVEAFIDSILRKRFDLLNKSIGIIKGYIGKDKEVLGNIVKLRSRKLSNMELDNELNDSVNQFYSIAEEHPELNKSEAFLKVQESINEAEEQLVAAKGYYNSKITQYNKSVKRFPTNITATLFKYKIKEYFNSKEKTVK